MTERQIQQVLENHKTPGTLHVRNIYLYEGWEMDVMHIMRSNHISEFEIKTNNPDFKADFKKPKHRLFKTLETCDIPNYFVYVCPEGVIKPEDVPEYAGLHYVVTKRNGLTRYIRIIKPAPILHNEVLGLEEWRSIAIKALKK